MNRKLNTDRKNVIRNIERHRIYYICPKCKQVLRIKTKYKKNLCMKCGQYLNWEDIESQWYTEYHRCLNREEADSCVAMYKRFSGIDWINDEIFADGNNPDNRSWPKELFFIFLERKGYGRFMRWIGKTLPPEGSE